MCKNIILRFLGVLFIMLLCFCWGCSANARSKMMLDSMKPIVKSINIGARKNPDAVLVRDSIPLGLIQMDGFIEVSPNDKFFLTTAAENYHAYALFFVEPDDKFAAERLYQTSRDYAYRALNQNVSFKNAQNGSLEDFSKSLRDFEKEDVPALYWAVASSLAWMRLSQESRFDSVVEFPQARSNDGPDINIR